MKKLIVVAALMLSGCVMVPGIDYEAINVGVNLGHGSRASVHYHGNYDVYANHYPRYYAPRCEYVRFVDEYGYRHLERICR
jgi:hypothetical protein